MGIDYKNTRPNDNNKNEEECKIWNAAIEEAAKHIDNIAIQWDIYISKEIRKLKK